MAISHRDHRMDMGILLYLVHHRAKTFPVPHDHLLRPRGTRAPVAGYDGYDQLGSSPLYPRFFFQVKQTAVKMATVASAKFTEGTGVPLTISTY